jgi:hypothetical protein
MLTLTLLLEFIVVSLMTWITYLINKKLNLITNKKLNLNLIFYFLINVNEAKNYINCKKT